MGLTTYIVCDGCPVSRSIMTIQVRLDVKFKSDLNRVSPYESVVQLPCKHPSPEETEDSKYAFLTMLQDRLKVLSIRG